VTSKSRSIYPSEKPQTQAASKMRTPAAVVSLALCLSVFVAPALANNGYDTLPAWEKRVDGLPGRGLLQQVVPGYGGRRPEGHRQGLHPRAQPHPPLLPRLRRPGAVPCQINLSRFFFSQSIVNSAHSQKKKIRARTRRCWRTRARRCAGST
jgi:hypothetical protein